MLAHVADHTDDIADAVSGLAAESIEHLSDHAIGRDLVDIRRQIDRLEAEFIRRVHRFHHNHGAIAEGGVSTVSWLRATCGLTGAAAAERMRMARVLDDLPQTTESFRAGRSSFSNVALISRLADEVGTDATRTVEPTLVVAAEKLDSGRMHRLVAFTRYRLDADGALERDNHNHERRWFSCDQTYGGVFVLRGELDAEGGAIVKTALDGLSAPSGPSDKRTGSQRRADALVDIAARQLQSGDLPAVHGQRPHLTLTASLETLRGEELAPPAELGGAGPIHPETARRLACDSVCTLALVAGSVDASTAGAALSVGRATRTIPAPIRTAVALRDKGCRFPGCDRPPEWTDGHHIKHWARHGHTKLPNVVSLCRRHHRMVHERGWTIHMDADGTVEVDEPAGRPPLSRRR